MKGGNSRGLMKKLLPVLVVFTLAFVSGCGMLLDDIAGEEFDESRLDTTNGDDGLSAPSGLTATVSGDSVYLDWNSVSGASSYKVYRNSSPSGSYSSIGAASTASYTDSSLSPGTYYYKVSAVSSSESESSLSLYNYATVAGGSGFSPSSSTPLSYTSWHTGTLTAGGVDWYSFTASGGDYSVSWNDSDGNGQFSCDIKVSAYTSGGVSIFEGIDRGYSSPQTISGRYGIIYLKVEGHNSSSSGNYAIRYYY
jgi:hypothetical protein